LIVLAACGGLIFWYFMDHPYFRLTAVRVYGAKRVPPQELAELAQAERGTSLFRLNVTQVRARIMQHPWIKDASVRRLYPNELEMTVYEREPAAVLDSGQVYLIDAKGYVLGAVRKTERGALPLLVGQIADPLAPGERVSHPGVGATLKVLAQVQASPLWRDMGITRIDFMGPERLVLQTRLGRLVVGPNMAEIDEKLTFLPAIGEVVRKKAKGLEYIDLSFADRLVIKTAAATGRRSERKGRSGGQAE